MPDSNIALLAFGLIAAIICLEPWRAPWRKRRWLGKRRFFKRHPKAIPFQPQRPSNGWPPVDANEQFRAVMGADFAKRRLLSKAEARVLYAAEDAIRSANLKWRVMGQVSLGEILTSTDAQAYAAINSKRVDLLVISNTGIPIAAIEYQGAGHYQGTAAVRDAVKKEALRKAGIRYIEITPEHGSEDVTREILRIAKIEHELAIPAE